MQAPNKIFEGTRILVAEDEPISRQILEACLKSWGFLVESYPDGSSAMMALRKLESPHIAILDWEMPGMDGIEICRRLREAERTVYVIMLTAKDGKQSLLEALNSGADDFLVKPSDPDELQARLRVGIRLIRLQSELEVQVRELRYAKEELDGYRRRAGM